MSTKTTDNLLKDRQRLLARIMDLGDALHGSIVERFTTCQRPACRCHQGERHGPRFYLSVNESGRQRQKYIRATNLAKARQGVEHHRQLLALIDALTALNLDILRASTAGD